MKTVIGLYDEPDDAREVVNDLIEAGIPAENINLLAGDPDRRFATQIAETGDEEVYDEADAAVDGALAGGVAGGLAGVLLGLGAFAIPGLGPVVAAGPIVSGLIGAGIGAASGGLIGALVEWGVSEEEAEFYVEGIRRGGTLVVVRTTDEQVDVVADIMDQQGLIDLEKRVSTWRDEGWTGVDPDLYADVVFDTHDSAFRRHYEENLAGTRFPYSSYSPAYQFGYYLGTQDRFYGRDWSELEPEARRVWEETHDEPWDPYKDAVEYSWWRAQTRIM